MREYDVARVWGIPIRVHISAGHPPDPRVPDRGGEQIGLYAGLIESLTGTSLDVAVLRQGNTPWLIGSVASIALFVSVLLHELGHAWMAMRYDLDVESITLWILGGLANLGSIPRGGKGVLDRRRRPHRERRHGRRLLPGAVRGARLRRRNDVRRRLAGRDEPYPRGVQHAPGVPDGRRARPPRAAGAEPAPTSRRPERPPGSDRCSPSSSPSSASSRRSSRCSSCSRCSSTARPTASPGWSRCRTLAEGVTVGELASGTEASIDVDATVDDLVSRMFADRRTQFVVTENGTPVGVVSAVDFKALSRRNAPPRPSTRSSSATCRASRRGWPPSTR